jgi:hypothetical protein
MAKVHTRDYLPKVEAAGVELIEPGRAGTAAFRKAVAPVHAAWSRRLGDGRLAARAVDTIRNA